MKRGKGNWICHILRRNCLPKHIIKGKLKGGIEVMKGRGRRRKQHLVDLKKNRKYSKMKGEALDRALWRNLFIRKRLLSRLQAGYG
jgi:hypothetical protein